MRLPPPSAKSPVTWPSIRGAVNCALSQSQSEVYDVLHPEMPYELASYPRTAGGFCVLPIPMPP